MSVLFDRGARVLLERAYARKGQWVGTLVAGPTPAQVTYFLAQGINVLGTDQWGRDRWAAGFIRAVYYQHRWFYAQGRFTSSRRMTANDSRGIRYELGRRKAALGIIPAGRAVRIVSKPGGGAAMNAVKKMPDSKRIYTDDGGLGDRWANPNGRDW